MDLPPSSSRLPLLPVKPVRYRRLGLNATNRPSSLRSARPEATACLRWSNGLLLDKQHQFAGGLAAFEIAMGRGRFRERVGAVDAQLEFAGGHPAQHVARAPEQFLARERVVPQARTREVERPFAVENVGVERRNRSAGLSEERQQAAWAQTIQTLLERGLAHRVIHYVDPAAAGQPLHFGFEIPLGVEDGFVRAGLARDAGFLFGGNGAGHTRARP